MRSLVVLALTFIFLAGCEGPQYDVDADRAAVIAREFVIGGQPAGANFREITVGTPELQTGHWRVQVDAVIDYPPPSQPGSGVHVHYLIDVDAMSGQPSMYAQG